MQSVKTIPSDLSVDLSEKRFRALIENAHEGIVISDNTGLIKYATPAVKKVSGFAVSDVLGKKGKDFIHPDFIDEARQAFKELIQKPGKTIMLVQKLRHKRGQFYWAECLLTNFLHVPEINGIVSNFRDITEKKIVEEQARQTQSLLETISQNLSEGIYMGILGKEYLHVNNAFLKMFGYKSIAEVKHVKTSVLYADKKHRKQILSELRLKSKLTGVEAEFLKSNGERFWGRMNITLLHGKDDYFVGTILDISKEKAAAEELVESRNFLNNVINTVAAPIFVKDAKHRWVMFNNSFCQLLGKSRQEIWGKTDKDLVPREEAKIFWQVDEEVLQTGKTIINEEKITVKGVVHDLLTVKALNINEKGEKFIIAFITDVTELKKVTREIHKVHANLQRVMESTKQSIYALDKNFNYTSFNKNHQRVMKLLYKVDIMPGANKLNCIKGSHDEKWLTQELKEAMKGKSFVSEKKLNYPQYHDHYIQLTYNPVLDEQGEVEGVAVFVMDITERKQTEARFKALNEELIKQNWQLVSQEEELKITLEELSQRNFELDQLMYKTSHDLRSPLSSILGLINLIRMDTAAEWHEEYIDKIEDRIKRLDDFIQSMLNYARANRAEVNITKIDLVELAGKCIHELEYLKNFNKVKTRVTIKNKEIEFRTDPLRVNIILSNIISNAYKYCNTETESFLKINITITPLTASIEFKDNGIGIKTEYQPKIFNMFFRATERSQGSGLGMYIVKQAVEKLEGTITLKSEHGKGTTIKITLPNK